ncbi:MAG: HAD family hydrolase [Candidatus Berkelbacteria bacterium]
MKPAVFLDRDGVINYNANPHDYVKKWDEFRFYKNAVKALKDLSKRNIFTVLVTNQRGISRNIMSHEDLLDIHKNMLEELGKVNASISQIYYCSHGHEDNCNCRKPMPGMFLQAAKEHEIILEKSFMVDDARSGIEAGKRAGCKTILVLTGNGRENLKTVDEWEFKPDYITKDLLSATKIICKYI